jgi:hypothetical protein
VKTYEGRRQGYAVDVTVDGRPLHPRRDLWDHSPSGFEWGYQGSGPAQLALALMADHFADDDLALALYQEFKRTIVSHLPAAGWVLTTTDLHDALLLIDSAARRFR